MVGYYLPGAKSIETRRLRFRHPFPLLDHFSESLLFLVFVENCVLGHAGLLAPVVSTLFALLPVLDVDLAGRVFLAAQFGDF